MEYPKWVPAGVVQVSSAFIQLLDLQLADLDAKLKTGRLSGRERFDAASRRRQLIEERERIERLTTDFRMKEAYTLLGPLDDRTWQRLFFRILAARDGLSEFRQAEGDEPEAEGDKPEVAKGELRKRMDDARRLSRRIAETAKELSRLIEELGSLNLAYPGSWLSQSLVRPGGSFPLLQRPGTGAPAPTLGDDKSVWPE